MFYLTIERMWEKRSQIFDRWNSIFVESIWNMTAFLSLLKSIQNLTRSSVFVEKHSKLVRYKGNREIHELEYARVW